MNATPPKLLSLAAVARRLDLPYSRAYRHFRAGLFQPDFLAPNNVACFRENRLRTLAAALKRVETEAAR